MRFEEEGLDEVIRALKRAKAVPQKFVTKAAREAMRPIYKASKSAAPYLSGELESGIQMKSERSREKGKKVFTIRFDPRKNDIFQKPNKEGKITGYYPVSQEYGYYAKNGEYIPGMAFIRDPFNASAVTIGKTVINVMGKQIERALK